MPEITEHVPYIVAIKKLTDKPKPMDLNGSWKKL
jgi:hypothetical protein